MSKNSVFKKKAREFYKHIQRQKKMVRKGKEDERKFPQKADSKPTTWRW
jgi:hypothetical protein